MFRIVAPAVVRSVCNNAFLINARDTGRGVAWLRVIYFVADRRARGNRWKAGAAARARKPHTKSVRFVFIFTLAGQSVYISLHFYTRLPYTQT